MAVSDPVYPGDAPVPRNAAERLTFAQLYETVVRVDCRGQTRPLLALSWTEGAGGRTWTFHLRPAARAWNGVAIGAEQVLESWLGGPAAPDVGALTVVDDSTLRVDLPRAEPLAFFARPELAVALPGGPGEWPAGTGPWRPESPTGGSSALVLRRDSGSERIELRPVQGDPRNALDGGVDLLVTRDPRVLDYAAASPRYGRVALPWDRVYMLLRPGAVPAPGRAPTRVELQALARDAVQVDARAPALTPAALQACVDSTAPEGATPPSGANSGPGAGSAAASAGSRLPGVRAVPARILYPEADPVAAGLAQRLVALARAGTAAWVVATSGEGAAVAAVGLPEATFRTSLTAGGEASFVLPLAETAGIGACALLSTARRRAPWLLPGQAVPLVETRPTAIVRAGVSGVIVDGAGSLLFGARETAGRRQ